MKRKSINSLRNQTIKEVRPHPESSGYEILNSKGTVIMTISEGHLFDRDGNRFEEHA